MCSLPALGMHCVAERFQNALSSLSDAHQHIWSAPKPWAAPHPHGTFWLLIQMPEIWCPTQLGMLSFSTIPSFCPLCFLNTWFGIIGMHIIRCSNIESDIPCRFNCWLSTATSTWALLLPIRHSLSPVLALTAGARFAGEEKWAQARKRGHSKATLCLLVAGDHFVVHRCPAWHSGILVQEESSCILT